MNTIAFLAGLVVGAAVAGFLLLCLFFVALEYRKHPEWLDEENEDYED